MGEREGGGRERWGISVYKSQFHVFDCVLFFTLCYDVFPPLSYRRSRDSHVPLISVYHRTYRLDIIMSTSEKCRPVKRRPCAASMFVGEETRQWESATRPRTEEPSPRWTAGDRPTD